MVIDGRNVAILEARPFDESSGWHILRHDTNLMGLNAALNKESLFTHCFLDYPVIRGSTLIRSPLIWHSKPKHEARSVCSQLGDHCLFLVDER